MQLSVAGFCCDRCAVLFSIDDPGQDQGRLERLLSSEPNCPMCFDHVLRPTTIAQGYKITLTLSAEQLWLASNGAGLPEQRAGKDRLEKIIYGSRIVEADLVEHTYGRCVIEWLRLDNGMTLHFALSGSGPTIYKVTTGEYDARKGSELRDDGAEARAEEHADGGEVGVPAPVAGDGS